jgi:purine-binding chemotaxis protein CheW
MNHEPITHLLFTVNCDMNNLLINDQSGDTALSKARQVTQFLKLVVFSMGGLNLALRIESVYKVVNHTPVYSSGLNHVGVAHMGEREVTVVDLYWRFFKGSQTHELSTTGYLVIVKNTTGELYGIPVAKTPVLIEVPLSMIRVLPESYRRADTLEVASHVAVIPQEGAPLTVFLLDVDLLLPIFQQITAAHLR